MATQQDLEGDLGRLLTEFAAGPVGTDSVERVRASAVGMRRRHRRLGAVGMVVALGLAVGFAQVIGDQGERATEVLSGADGHFLPGWVPPGFSLHSVTPPVMAPVVFQAVYRDRAGRRWVTLTSVRTPDARGPGSSPETFRTTDGGRVTLTHKAHVDSWWSAVRADGQITVIATFQGFNHDTALAAAKTIRPAVAEGADAYVVEAGTGMIRTLSGPPAWKTHWDSVSYSNGPARSHYIQIDIHRTSAPLIDLSRANSIFDRTVRVRGHRAILLRPGPTTRPTVVVWTEAPGVVMSVSTTGLGASATIKIAHSLHPVSDSDWEQATSTVQPG